MCVGGPIAAHTFHSNIQVCSNEHSSYIQNIYIRLCGYIHTLCFACVHMRLVFASLDADPEWIYECLIIWGCYFPYPGEKRSLIRLVLLL